MNMTRTLCAALLAAACWTTPLRAQQPPTQRQLDSLAAQGRGLRESLRLGRALHQDHRAVDVIEQE